MNEQHPRLYFILFLGCAVLAAIFLYTQWMETIFVQETLYTLSQERVHSEQAVALRNRQRKPAIREIKSIYLTAYSAASDAKRAAMIDLINRTELNAVVIDIKDYTGYVLYDSDIELINTLGTETDRLGDVSAIVDDFHKNGIYVIARQTVFQDPVLARAKPEWAIKSKAGGLWRDYKGLAWVDPSKNEVWAYNMAIAKEVAAFGFDEINFDYVRFPTDGNMSLTIYENGDKALHEVMEGFFAYLDEQMRDEPVRTSADLFGLVMDHDTGIPAIGQRLSVVAPYVDYICPMMYPSHYPSGYLGLGNPAAYPGEVFTFGMKRGLAQVEGQRAVIRPWIQAFHLGAQYGATNIRAQIDAIEAYGEGGWMMWNAANRYTEAGLAIE